MKVFVLSRWNEIDDIFGSICVFDTLRIGFPNADIEIYHGGGGRLITEAHQVQGANLTYIHHSFRHDEWIRRVVSENEGEIVFVDTDMIFYTNVEDKLTQYPALIAGRKVRPYYNEVVKADEVERLHTSLLYIKNSSRLKHFLSTQVDPMPNYPLDPYAPFQFRIEGNPFFFDTCANMYHMIPENLKHGFTEDLLNCYTHLYSGTMLNHVSSRLVNGERLKKLHFMAKENPKSVQGLWKEQEHYYLNHPLRCASLK